VSGKGKVIYVHKPSGLVDILDNKGTYQLTYRVVTLVDGRVLQLARHRSLGEPLKGENLCLS
jgi:hypothetical protein